MARGTKSSARARRPHSLPKTADVDQQVLAFELPAAANESLQPTASPHLWLCIQLPLLPLEALSGTSDSVPQAVFEDVDGVRRVLQANDDAVLAGISPGLSVNAALALLPELELRQRDIQQEQQALLKIAAWAEQYTSCVTLEPPTMLLLELAGSRRLFGGLRELRQTLSQGLDELGFSALLAIAPTPLAASWLARAGRRVCIRERTNLTGALSALPLQSCNWPLSVCELLQGMGIARVGDCLRLPRQGFAKRAGVKRLLELDRALGKLPDPRSSYRSPETFCEDRELTTELDDRDIILRVCRLLLGRLQQFLLARQQTVSQIVFSFFHLEQSATQVPVARVQTGHEVEHWFDLLQIRFERISLPAPVIAIRLQTGNSHSFTAANQSLPFSSNSARQRIGSATALLERLSARFGDELVYGMSTVEEHRPDYAWKREWPVSRLPRCQAKRPLWLLREPQKLATQDDRPLYHGLLALIEGPERLETGWWDDDGIARDYYIATSSRGTRLWVYRDRGRTGRWFLHGVFG